MAGVWRRGGYFAALSLSMRSTIFSAAFAASMEFWTAWRYFAVENSASFQPTLGAEIVARIFVSSAPRSAFLMVCTFGVVTFSGLSLPLVVAVGTDAVVAIAGLLWGSGWLTLCQPTISYTYA